MPGFQQDPGQPSWTPQQAMSSLDHTSFIKTGYLLGDPESGVAGDVGAFGHIADAQTFAGATAALSTAPAQPWLQQVNAYNNSGQYAQAQSLLTEGEDWDENNIDLASVQTDPNVNLGQGFIDIGKSLVYGAEAVGALGGALEYAPAAMDGSPVAMGKVIAAGADANAAMQDSVNSFSDPDAQAALKVIIQGLDLSSHWEGDFQEDDGGLAVGAGKVESAPQAPPKLVESASFIASLQAHGELKAGALNGITIANN